MLKYIILFFINILCAQSILDKTQDKYIWDLSSLYKDDIEWKTDYTQLKSDIKSFHINNFNINTDDGFLALLNTARRMRIKAGSLAIYGILMTNLDNKSESSELLYYQGIMIENETEKTLSPLKSIVLNKDRDKLVSLLKNDQRFKIHETRINRILMEGKRKLTTELDQLLISYHGRIQHSGDNYHALMQSITNWPIIEIDNEAIQISNQSFIQYRKKPKSEQKTKLINSFLIIWQFMKMS